MSEILVTAYLYGFAALCGAAVVAMVTAHPALAVVALLILAGGAGE